MWSERGNEERIESVRTVVAHVVVKGKHSFAAPTTRATAVITIVRKINRPCVMAPYGLIPQWLEEVDSRLRRSDFFQRVPRP